MSTNFAPQTPEEKQLGLVDLTGLSPEEANEKLLAVSDRLDAEEEELVANGASPNEAHEKIYELSRHVYPNEDDVVALAGLWSIDPSLLTGDEHPPALGLLARLPEAYSL